AKTQDDGKSWVERANDGDGVPRTDRVSSFAPFMPALFVCGPLIATDYPIGMVFVTPHGIQLLALSEQMRVHPESLGSWPFGFPVNVLGTSGGVRTIQLPGWSSGESLTRFLDILVGGANRFLDRLTDPFTWKSASNEINAIEQRIAWTSVLTGMESVVQMGKEWTNPESVWTAFRSLTMLEGLWGPWLPSERRLRMLLDPRVIREYAISQFPHRDYMAWSQTVCQDFEAQLTKIPRDGNLDTSLDLVEEIRNLLHGAGGQSKRRTDKIRALEAIHDLDVALVKHVAVFWWTSAVLAPEKNGIPGKTPFPKYAAGN
ncbi:MAG TPA: hypothetical protein VHA53_07580, partial [Nitrolancea sp.]|nr:hypothetical protein [Nitrolancea sp.]